MKKILLVDADSKIPNIPLMKLAMYHKKRGDYVELVCCKLPYYPNKKKNIYYVPKGYDKVYCSVLFKGNIEYIKGHNVIFGGTGYDLKTVLPNAVEKCASDYSIYPNNNISYGFISRGCVRNCFFCVVPKKEGKLQQVSTINAIIQHKKVKFLDNNFLALPNHKELLNELISKKIKCQFNQGLDIRFINKENSILLSKLNYLGGYIFAFDAWKDKDVLEKKLALLFWRKPYSFKFFVYVTPKMPINEIIFRIEWLRKKQCLPYIMRDISCWKSDYSPFYTDIAAYCNQPHIFKKMEFGSFLKKRSKDFIRIEYHTQLYHEGCL